MFDSIPQQLHPLSVEAVRALRTHGIFRSSVEALANDANLFHDLSRDAQMLLGGRRYNARSGSDTIPTMPNGMWCEPSAIVPSGRRCPHLSSGFFFTRRHSASPVPNLGLQVRLNHTDVWHNIPVHEGEPPISRSPRSFGIAIMRINGSSNCLCF